MSRIETSLSLVAGLLLSATPVTATESLMAEPRMVGDVEAGQSYVEDATAVGDDFPFLGTHGRERLSLRWFDAARERRDPLPLLGGLSPEQRRRLRQLGYIEDRPQ